MSTETTAAPADAPSVLAEDAPEADVRASVRRLLPYARDHRKALVALSVLSVVNAATDLAQPALVGAITGRATSGGAIAGLIWLLVVVALVNVALSAWHQFLLQKTAHGVVFGVRRRLVDRLMRLPMVEYDRRTTGDLVSRVGADTAALHHAVTGGTVEAAGSVLVCLGAAVLAVLIDPVLFGLTILTFALGAAVSMVAVRGVQALQRKEQDEVGLLSASTLRALGAIRTIRSAGATDVETAQVVDHADRAYAAGVRTSKRAALVLPAAQLGQFAAMIVVLTVGGVRIGNGSLGIGEFVAFLLYQGMVIGPVFRLIRSWTSLQRGLGALQRIDDIEGLPTESEVTAVVRDSAASAAGTVAGPTGSGDAPAARPPLIRFRDVSFDYGEGRGLREVNIDVERGSTVALVGPSGAGKSTILALIERFYEPASGSIDLDGIDVRSLPHETVRGRIAYAEQDPAVLEGTLRSNVALGDPDADDARVRAALAEVNLSGLEERTDDGLDLAVGERGVRLSGGEKQRLTIARALLPGRDLLLLDEPTAQLDPANEDQLRGAIRSRPGRTVIVAAHRLSTVMDADRIVVMEEGRVVATGTHAELVASNPLYASMARAQRLA